MAIFRSRKPKAPAATSTALTFAELETAVEAARSQLYGDGTAARTLEGLYAVFDDAPAGPLAELAAGPQLVTAEEVDQAIDEAAEVLGQRSATIGVLKEARAFIARAEQAGRPAAPVGERVLAIALLSVDRALQRQGHADGNVLSCFERFAAAARLTREETASAKRLLQLIDEIGDRYAAVERGNARLAPGQPWSTM